MEIAVSSLPFQGLSIGSMRRLPKDVGIEIFSECGNDYYWDHWLPRLLEGRTVPLSVHAPFQNLDLSDPKADFEAMRKAYHWAFDLCKRYGARHCTCHPYEGRRPKDDTPERKEAAKRCSLERVLQLNREARDYGVELLVENMPHTPGLLDQREFIELFAPHEELSFLIDTGHAHLWHWDMTYAFQTLGERIHAYHIHDNGGESDSHLHVWEGTFDWDTFFAGYARYTPEAVLVCEYDAGPLDKVIESVDRIRKHLSAQT